MAKKYKYNTLPKREVFVERLLEKISDEHKDVVDILLDCNEWYNKENGKPLLNTMQMQTITVFMHYKYTNLQNYVEAEIDEFNDEVNRKDTGSHIVQEKIL